MWGIIIKTIVILSGHVCTSNSCDLYRTEEYDVRYVRIYIQCVFTCATQFLMLHFVTVSKITNAPYTILVPYPPPPQAYHMQLLPCPPGFTRDSVDPRQHAVVVAFDHDRADYAGGAPFYLSYLKLSPLDLSYSYLATKECHPAQPKHKNTNIMQKQWCFLHPPLHKNVWDASCLFGTTRESLPNCWQTSLVLLFDKLSLLSNFWLVPVA